MLFLVDVDGVICDFISGLIKSHGWDMKHDDFASWSHHHSIGVTDEEMWSVTNDGEWWTKLPEYTWAQALMAGIRSRGDVVFCTSPSHDHTCPSQKVKWLRDHGFLGERSCDYQIGPRKELNAKSGAILVDDSDSNVSKYREAGGTAVLFPQPWNAGRGDTSRRAEDTIMCIDMLIERGDVS